MNYTFRCTDPECDAVDTIQRSMAEGPPDEILCPVCESFAMTRDWQADRPQLICRSDPDEVGAENLMHDTGGMSAGRAVRGISKAAARKKERAFQEEINRSRRVFREEGQKGGKISHKVPAELYHAKIKQTGDKDYWRDSSNLNRHKSCKVS